MSASTESRPDDTTEVDPIRAFLHAGWAAVAPAWGQHIDYADARGAAVTDRMLALTSPRPGERLLELACGPGTVGLAAAGAVGPDGSVVLSDVVPEMVAVAAARADRLRVGNVTTAVLDLEEIDQPDDAYDVVVCREGLMFATDPTHAVREIARVMRPGGRVAVAVWGPPEDNPWLGVILEVLAAQLGRPVPPPGIPGPFSLGDVDELSALLAGAGFADVVVEQVPAPLHAATFEEWWARTSALAGPLANILTSLPDDAKEALALGVREAVRPYETGDGLAFPGVSLVGAGRRPLSPT